MEDFAIYFSDLTYGAQQRLMEAVGIDRPEEMNWDMDIIPLVYYPVPCAEDEVFFNVDFSAI